MPGVVCVSSLAEGKREKRRKDAIVVSLMDISARQAGVRQYCRAGKSPAGS